MLKSVLFSIVLIPYCCFAQRLNVDIIKATGDTMYSSKLQTTGGFGSAGLSIFKTKDKMQLELLKLINKG